MTFAELYTRFLAEGEVKAYHIDRSKLFLPFFSEMQIGQITRNDIARYPKYRHEKIPRQAEGGDPKAAL